MADIRNVAPSSLPQVRPAARTDTVRTAQRAFFEAALNGAVTAPAPSASTLPRQAKVEPTRAATSATSAPPNPNLRPGSLLDIKV